MSSNEVQIEKHIEKVSQLTFDQFKRLQNSNKPDKLLKKYVGLDGKSDYAVGDTAVVIPSSELYGIYRLDWNGRSVFYFVVSVLGDDLAFAWSLYPVRKEAV